VIAPTRTLCDDRGRCRGHWRSLRDRCHGGHHRRQRPKRVVEAAAGPGHCNIHVDGVVLNAGLGGCQSVLDLDRARYRRMWDVNVNGVLNGIAEVAPHLRAQRGGFITVTASMAGLIGVPFDPLYAMTKHAVIGLVRGCADELATAGIRLQAVCPGLVDTPLIGRAKQQTETAGYPLLDAAAVADVLFECVFGRREDRVVVVQAGREPMPLSTCRRSPVRAGPPRYFALRSTLVGLSNRSSCDAAPGHAVGLGCGLFNGPAARIGPTPTPAYYLHRRMGGWSRPSRHSRGRTAAAQT